MQNPYAASHEGGKRPFPGPHASGLPTGRAMGSSKRGESGEEQLRPSVPPSPAELESRRCNPAPAPSYL